jgi:hypothetical protein
MKKIAVILCFFLACCNTPIPVNEYHFSYDAFDTSAKCPHICWLGINPGVTTSSDAHKLLRASEWIDQKRYHVEEEEYINTGWYYESTKSLCTNVTIQLSGGFVQSITIESMWPFKIGEFVNLFGTPDKINIRVVDEPDAILVPYDAYYSSRKLRIQSEVSQETDPSPDNIIGGLSMNVEMDSEYTQPWLGFGHLREYLAGQNFPPFPLPRPDAP